jgi:hypothetical protein
MGIKFYGNDIVEIIDDGIIVKDVDDVFGLFIMNTCSTIIIKKENVVNNFLDLSTGIAGETLQKFSNYHKRMAIFGDFTNTESNKTGQIIFANRIEEALKIFNE